MSGRAKAGVGALVILAAIGALLWLSRDPSPEQSPDAPTADAQTADGPEAAEAWPNSPAGEPAATGSRSRAESVGDAGVRGRARPEPAAARGREASGIARNEQLIEHLEAQEQQARQDANGARVIELRRRRRLLRQRIDGLRAAEPTAP